MKIGLFLRSLRVLALPLAIVAAFASPANADDPSLDGPLYSVSLGFFDSVQLEEEALQVRVEYRHDKGLGFLKPFGGFMVNDESAAHLYAGVLIDWYVSDSFVITPSFAPGLYMKGQSKDLGYLLQFRSQIEFAYRFDGGTRLGINLNHISNAGLGKQNPGSESISISLIMPVKYWW
ncbi:MAG: acyloxyacyl hydrolase [Minwuia sp.]|nr:acyloxyacyl hydrolase [Minwuia sp.]